MRTSTALRIGSLRAARIAPTALLRAAWRLPEVRVVAFAARAGGPEMRAIESVCDRAAVRDASSFGPSAPQAKLQIDFLPGRCELRRLPDAARLRAWEGIL